MKRRLLIGIPVAVGILLLVTFLSMRSYFNEARILALLQPRLEAALGRPVTVTGASLQTWPLSVSLQGIAVQERTTGTTAQLSGAVFELQTLLCRVDPGPLLRRKLLIQSLTLDSLRVRLQQRADSTWNVQDTQANDPAISASTTSDAAESTPLALTIRSLQIRNAVIELEQLPTQSAAHIPFDAELRFELNRDMSRVSIAGDVQCSGVQETRGTWSVLQDVRLRLQPRMQIDVPDSSAEIEALTLSIQDLELQLSGAVHLRNALPYGKLQTTSPSLQLASLLSLVPGALAPELDNVDASGLVSLDLGVELRGSQPPLVNGSLQLADGSLQVPELPAPLEDIQADVLWQGDRIDIRKVAARFQQEPLQLRGVIHDPLQANAARYELSLQGELSLQAASAFASMPPGTTMGGSLSADCQARGLLNDPESLQLDGKVSVKDAIITTPQSRQPVHLQGEAFLANEEIRFEHVQVTIGRSQAQLSGRAAPIRAGSLPRIELQGKSARLDFDEILPQARAQTQQAAGDAAGTTPTKAATSTLLPAHPPNEIELTLEIAETQFQLARWAGIQVHASASPDGFQVRARVDSLVRDALHLRDMNLQLEGDSLLAKGSFTAGHSTLGRVQARQLRSQLVVETTLVHLQDMVATLYGGSLQGHSTLDLADAENPQYTLQLDMQAVEAGAMLADVLPGGQWMTGKLSGSSTWKSSGAAPQTLRSNLTATGQAQASAGALHRFPVVDAVTNTLRMQDLPSLAYKDLDLQFSVADGRVSIPELRLIGSDLTALSQGSIDLSGQMDLKLNVVLSEEQTKRSVRGDIGQAVTRLFADPQGRLVMDFDVGGTVKKPQVQADLQSTASRNDLHNLGADELGRLLDQFLPKDKDNVGDALRRGLGGLLGRDKKSTTPADSTQKP